MRARLLPMMLVASFLVGIGCGSVTTNDSVGAAGRSGTSTGDGFAGSSTAGTKNCIYNGIAHPEGSSYAVGCGTCYCRPGAVLECNVALIMPSKATCEYGGIWMTAGDSLPSMDDCNTCTCQDTSPTCSPGPGIVACTQLDCTGACSYAGRTFPDGATIPATDGCNSCSCANGIVRCGNEPCSCDPKAETWRRYDKMSATECAAIELACPKGTTAFTNGCGCGCEQSPECPTQIVCLPNAANSGTGGGASTDCSGRSICPLSQAVTL